jgi:hypothetical protein
MDKKRLCLALAIAGLTALSATVTRAMRASARNVFSIVRAVRQTEGGWRSGLQLTLHANSTSSAVRTRRDPAARSVLERDYASAACAAGCIARNCA